MYCTIRAVAAYIPLMARWSKSPSHILRPYFGDFEFEFKKGIVTFYGNTYCFLFVLFQDENIIVDLRTHRLHLIDFGSGHWWRGEQYCDFDGQFIYCTCTLWEEKSVYLSLMLSRLSVNNDVLSRTMLMEPTYLSVHSPHMLYTVQYSSQVWPRLG